MWDVGTTLWLFPALLLSGGSDNEGRSEGWRNEGVEGWSALLRWLPVSALSNPPTLQRVWRGTSSPLCCFVLSPTHTQRDKWEFVKLFVYLCYKLPAASRPHTHTQRSIEDLHVYVRRTLDFSGWKAEKTTSWCVFKHFSEAQEFETSLQVRLFFPPGWWNSLYFSFRFHSFQLYSPSHWKSSVWPDERVRYAVCIDFDR